MDVEEYLNMFLDKLENSIKGTDRAGTINYHFGGQLANEMIGKTCPHRFTRLEPMLSVGVTVKNKKSVKEGMEAFIQGDMLEADN
jgi:ubiquitin carboxyl-terminal hydrolase 9/24